MIFSGSSTPPALPETLRRFIGERISVAGDDAVLVACAPALDGDTAAADLVEVVELEEFRVLDALDELLTLGILDQPRIGPQFAFAHDLIRETAATLAGPGRRVRMHAAFARRLEGAAERNSSLRRARHLTAAGQSLAGAQRYLEAAIEALECFAWRDALDRSVAGLSARPGGPGAVRATLTRR